MGSRRALFRNDSAPAASRADEDPSNHVYNVATLLKYKPSEYVLKVALDKVELASDKPPSMAAFLALRYAPLSKEPPPSCNQQVDHIYTQSIKGCKSVATAPYRPSLTPKKGGIARPDAFKGNTPLKVSETAWRPGSKVKAAKTTDDEEIVRKKTKAILNKISPQTFEKLSGQFIAVGLTNETKMKIAIVAIFEKALDEEFYGALYAQLCRKLSEMEVIADEKDEDGNPKMLNFRRMLVMKCQMEFERITSQSKEDKEKDLEDIDDDKERTLAQNKLKRHLIGYMKFVAELHNLEMIRPIILPTCMKELLSVENRDDEHIECACKLAKTAGYSLESTPQTKGMFDEIFVMLEKAQEGSSTRIKFMIQDLQDLRHAGWGVNPNGGRKSSKRSNRDNNSHRDGGNSRNNGKNNSNDNSSNSGKKGNVFGRLNYPDSPRKQDARSQGERKNGGPPHRIERPKNSAAFPNREGRANGRPPQHSKNITEALSAPLPLSPQMSSTSFDFDSTDPTLLRKAKGILQEYLDIKDQNEVVECLKEIKSSDGTIVFVITAMVTALEGREKDQLQIMELMEYLIEDSVVSAEAYEDALVATISKLVDIVIDAPMATKFFGSYFALGIYKAGVQLETLQCSALDDLESYIRVPLIVDTLAKTIEKLPNGMSTFESFLDRDNIDRRKLFPQDADMEDVQRRLEEKGLASLLKAEKRQRSGDGKKANTPAKSSSKPLGQKPLPSGYSYSALKAEMKATSSPRKVLEWIKAQMGRKETEHPKFLFDLMMSIISYVCKRPHSSLPEDCDKNARPSDKAIDLEARLAEEWLVLLKPFVKDGGLHVLCTVQTFAYNTGNPRDFLWRWFGYLKQFDVIESEVFTAWMKDTSVSEKEPYHGKGPAKVVLRDLIRAMSCDSDDEADDVQEPVTPSKMTTMV